MFFKSREGMTISIIDALFLGVCMTTTVTVMGEMSRTFLDFISSWGTSFWLTLGITILLPIPMWGKRTASALKLKTDGPAYWLVENIVPTLIYNTENTLIMSAIHIFGNSAIPQAERLGIWASSLPHDWPICFVVAYAAAVVGGLIGKAVARKTQQHS